MLTIIYHNMRAVVSNNKKGVEHATPFLLVVMTTKSAYSPSLFAIFSFNKSPRVVVAAPSVLEYFLIASASS